MANHRLMALKAVSNNYVFFFVLRKTYLYIFFIYYVASGYGYEILHQCFYYPIKHVLLSSW